MICNAIWFLVNEDENIDDNLIHCSNHFMSLLARL